MKATGEIKKRGFLLRAISAGNGEWMGYESCEFRHIDVNFIGRTDKWLIDGILYKISVTQEPKHFNKVDGIKKLVNVDDWKINDKIKHTYEGNHLIIDHYTSVIKKICTSLN